MFYAYSFNITYLHILLYHLFYFVLLFLLLLIFLLKTIKSKLFAIVCKLSS